MATIDKYNNLLDELVNDTKKLAASLSNLQKRNSERTIEIEKILAEAHYLILNTIPEGDLIDVLAIFSELESNISEYNALKSASDFQKSSELTIQESLKLNKEHTIISETLQKTIAGIDDYLASLRRRAKIPRLKPRPIKHARAEDIPSVLFIDSVLSSMNQSFKTLEVELKSTEKSIRTLIRSFPEPLLNIVKTINQLLIGLNESIEKLREQNILFDETPQKIPKSVTEWLSILSERLQEREQHLSPNLPLSAGDLRNFSANLFDVDLDRKRNTIHLIEQELKQIQSVMKNHFEKVDYNLFDIGSPTKKKKDKLSSKFRNILNQHVQTTVDMKGFNKRKKRFETLEKKICSNLEDMLAQASNSTRAHFKESPFSILLMTALKIKPAKYVDAYKKSWHTYPNYHLCFELISSSDKSVRKLDRLIKLPISSKLCKACLTDELTQDQAMILQDIDTHNDLYELFNSHNIDLGLVFALHAQEGKKWFYALLENPELYEIIEEHRHDIFDERLWRLVVQERLQPWQYACIVRLNFSEESALDTLLLADDVWSDLNEFAALYDVAEELKKFVGIYRPKKDDSSSSATLSLTDVMKAIDPIADYTVNKSVSSSKVVKRKKKNRYKL